MIIEYKPITKIIIIKFLQLRALGPLPCQQPLDPHDIFVQWRTQAVGVNDHAAFLCNVF